MAEYIEREAAIAKLTALEFTNPSATMTDAKRLLADMPAADVAPVVRCKDCKYWHKETLFCDYMPYGEARERVNWYADDFCSYGERKGGDSDG